MRAALVISALAAMAAACASPPLEPAALQAWPGYRTPARAAPLAAILLPLHNRARAEARVPPLVWDPALAAAADHHARRLAATGVMRHAPKRERPGQGENLWMGTRGGYAPHQMAGNWIAERRYFRPGIFPNVSTTGNWADVGHYSQMIWPTTRRLGCGLASGARYEFLVCRYSPPGNVDGRRVP